MKERPILFSAPMVRAILEGRKTQTRRIVKFDKMHADMGDPNPDFAWVDGSYMQAERGGIPCLKVPYGFRSENETWHRYFPKWEPGDRLWVKETFARLNLKAFAEKQPGSFVYRADSTTSPHLVFRPSIFMPRWASRITLEITGVRVERLQAISNDDACAEGCFTGRCLECGPEDWPELELANHHYMHLWESINGAGSWDLNHWVWVIEFKKL